MGDPNRSKPTAAASAAPPPRPAKPARKRRWGATDVLLTACGVALGVGCAYFPWYVFVHQNEFGITPMKFEGRRAPTDMSGPFYTPSVDWGPRPVETAEVPPLLDPVPTGTLPARGTQPQAPGDQPFPTQPVGFRVVHIQNGRAMIQDASGLWVVERGSILPDNSKVEAIVRRDGKWIVITTGDRVLELPQPAQ